VVKAAKPIRTTIAAPLVDAGVLDETRHKRLGLFATTRYPERDPSPELTVRSELQAVLLSDQAPSDFAASLLGLLVPMDLVTRLVDRNERKAAKARAKAVAERGPVGDAVKSAVQQQIAAVVAISAATAAATTATTSN
jgi:Golgi phosphoprotein 3